MTWFADLSPCTYHDWTGDRLAVGWLGADHPFEAGSVEPALREGIFLERLLWGVRHRSVDVFRGYHSCEFCDRGTGDEHGRTFIEGAQGELLLGTAQVEVMAVDGVRYVAPNLLLHYITEHGYRPPEPFVDAVILGAFQSEPREAGSLWVSPNSEVTVDRPFAEDLVFGELARRMGTDASSIRRVVTIDVTAVGRVLASIPERLPSFCLWVAVTGGPTFRRGWTEWAPTDRASAAAVTRLFADELLVEALEEALTS